MATITAAGGDPVDVVIYRDEARTREGTHTLYWVLDAAAPVVSLAPPRLAGGTLTFVYSAAALAALTAGVRVTLDPEDCPRVPAQTFVVERCEVTHALDDPTSTQLLRAQIQRVA